MPRYHPDDLPRFFAAIRADETAQTGISQSTFERRRAGKMPPIVAWLIERPHLLRALYLDSCDRSNVAPDCGAHENAPTA